MEYNVPERPWQRRVFWHESRGLCVLDADEFGRLEQPRAKDLEQPWIAWDSRPESVQRVAWERHLEDAEYNCCWASLNIKAVFLGKWIPMLRIKRSRDRLIFNIGVPIPVRRQFYIETAAPRGVVYGCPVCVCVCVSVWRYCTYVYMGDGNVWSKRLVPWELEEEYGELLHDRTFACDSSVT